MSPASQVAFCAAAVLLAAVARSSASSQHANQDVVFARGKSPFVVAAPSTALEKRTVAQLCQYLAAVVGKPVKVVDSLSRVPNGIPTIVLTGARVKSPIAVRVPSGSEEAFAIAASTARQRPVVVCRGASDRGLKRAVQRLVIMSEQRADALVIPGCRISERPWIPYREWTICPWTPSHVRGVFHNPYADSRLNIYLYDQNRLARYVDMFDWFGFSGCQLMETCYTFAQFGSIEATHDWQRRVARLLRSNGQQVTLWVWAAEFSGYGWRDPDVKYSPRDGMTAFEDPEVRRVFEKYYAAYADLAPVLDRCIGHFYDPGHLTDRADVYAYMRLLERRLKAKNPRIQMAIDCWAAKPEYMLELAENGFADYLLLAITLPEIYPQGSREALHRKAKDLGLTLGMWGWYTTEYETDQLASMYVNCGVLKNLYSKLRDGALKIKPVEYWSEMEAHHLNDIYSMYVASRLLWNPDLDPHEALAELVNGIWGPKNGPKVMSALRLIEDTRSGPSWDTYWWTRSTYRIGTERPMDDLRRAAECLDSLKSMKRDGGFVPKFPLPYPPETLVELMLPHLEQIRLFAEFRIKIAELNDAAAKGADRQRLEEMLTDAWQPVPEMGTWIGVFGGPELRQQKKIIEELVNRLGLTVKDPSPLRYMEADRLLQVLRTQQGQSREMRTWDPQANIEFFWPPLCQVDRFEKLIADGVVTRLEDGRCKLADWSHWAAR